MKIQPRQVDAFLNNPDANVVAVLVYGPDRGLVGERATRLVKSRVDDPSDPFRVCHLSPDVLKADPARLADEALALSLTGGGRVVRIADAPESLAPLLESFLVDNEFRPAQDMALMVIEAGTLGPRGALRKLFETATNGAALACYEDDARTLEPVIRETLGGAGLTIERDALAYLVSRLGGDRAMSRGELEKLVLYMGSETIVTLAHARAAVDDSAGLDVEAVALAAASGDFHGLDSLIQRAYTEGTHPVQIVRSAIRHFQRLHLARGLMDRDRLSAEDAVKKMRPPPIFKIERQVASHLRAWTAAGLAHALDILTEAEIQVKSTGMPGEAVTHRALMRIAGRARKKAA